MMLYAYIDKCVCMIVIVGLSKGTGGSKRGREKARE
jgi:hypothetical protein